MDNLPGESESESEFFEKKRLKMVAEQIESRGLRELRLLAAMRRVPRHRFVSLGELDMAYYDGPLPIGCGQTISQPYIVALMTSLAALKGEETVLEVGTGSGYQAAVLACMARRIITIERHPELADRRASYWQDWVMATLR
jgi:protein-L-isoaspartate(D-aspartate) O-methyltransferase